MTDKEERLLKKLRALHGRREYHAWRLGDVDRQITEATRALAAERGCSFIRPETVRAEIVARDEAAIREAANGG